MVPLRPTWSSVISPSDNCHQFHAGEAEALEYSRHIFLVPADAVERFGDDDLNLAQEAFVEQGLDARAQKVGAAQSGVGINPGHRPAGIHDKFSAKPNLILDRGFTLVVGTISGVDRGAGHGGPQGSFAEAVDDGLKAACGMKASGLVVVTFARCGTGMTEHRQDDTNVLGILKGDRSGRTIPESVRTDREAKTL